MNHAPGALPDPERDAQFYDGVPARRLFAFIIDFVLVWCMALAIGVLTLGIGFLMLGFIIFAVDFVYRVTTISNRSATLGMRLVGVELRRRDGGRFNLGDALAHTILFYIACSFIVLQLISVVLMAGSAMGRGLHDIPLGSTMINSPE
ncbi:RDD family protein [Pikeienuella sp. HZG-20]|uniref:RDD family protein n=1 Tax=Paludibacillus litoralis TaxID=3133267 RepID=UPI0030EB882E